MQDSILRLGLLLLLVAPAFSLIAAGPYKLSIPIASVKVPVSSRSTHQESLHPPASSLAMQGDLSEAPRSSNLATSVDTPNKRHVDAVVPSVNSPLNVTSSQVSSSWPMLEPFGYLAMIVWGVGFTVALVQIARAHVKSQEIKNRSGEIDDPLWLEALARATVALGMAQHNVKLRSSENIASPVLIGLRTPTILIPTKLLKEELSDNACEHIVTHELIHVQRCDMTTNLLLQVAVALWWWHPLVHWLKIRTTVTRELICDATTSHYQNAEDYAETLLQLTIFRGHEPKLALSIAGRHCDLERRIAWILAGPSLKQIRSINRTVNRSLFAAFCTLFLLASIVRFTPAATHEPDNPESSAVPVNAAPTETTQTPDASDVEPTAENMFKLPPLISSTEIQGRVKMPDGNPAANADVYLLYIPPRGVGLKWTPISTKTNSAGVFTFSNVAPGRYTFWATTSDLISHFNAIVGRALQVQENPTRLDRIEIKLHGASTYRFKVTDVATGLPLEGATIRPFPAPLIPVKVTDQNGIAEYKNLTADEWHFTVHKPGYAYTVKSSPQQPLGSRANLTVQLAKGGTLRGNVIDEDGQGVVNCNITLTTNDSWPGPEFPEVISAADGSFELDGVPMNKEIQIAVDSETHDVITKKFVISSDQSTVSLKLIVPKRKPSVASRFHVTDEDSHPIENAKLVNYGFRKSSSDKTDSGGYGELVDIFNSNFDGGPKNLQVTVSAVGYLDAKISVSEDSTLESPPLSVVLKKVPVFVGRMVTPEGQPLQDVDVIAANPADRFQSSRSGKTDKDGIFVINDIKNEVLLSFTPPAPYLSRIQARYEIQPGDKGPKEIKLEYGGSIRVRAVDAETGIEVPLYKVRIGYSEDYETSGFSYGYSYGFPSELARGVDVVAGGTEFRMNDQRIGAPYMVNVIANGYVPAKLPRVPSVKSDEAPITLVQMHKVNVQNSMIVTGALRDNGQAVVNAKVCLISSTKPEEVISWQNLEGDHFKNMPQCIQYLETTSDDQGKFQFEGVSRLQDIVEIYYFHQLGDQRFRNLKLDVSKPQQNFVLVAEPKVKLQLQIDPQHYPQAEYVSVGLPLSRDPDSPLPIAFAHKTFQISQFSNGRVVTVNLPPGRYRIDVNGKSEPVKGTSFSSAKLLVRRNLALTLEESGMKIGL
jgi:beta-lactamase regulating signal transducer with metallopeptidase domain